MKAAVPWQTQGSPKGEVCFVIHRLACIVLIRKSNSVRNKRLFTKLFKAPCQSWLTEFYSHYPIISKGFRELKSLCPNLCRIYKSLGSSATHFYSLCVSYSLECDAECISFKRINNLWEEFRGQTRDCV